MLVDVGLIDSEPGEGRMFVSVEYQFYGLSIGHLRENALHLVADGEMYSPVNSVNELYAVGRVLNGAVVYNVPDSVTSFSVIGGTGDGETTEYEIIIE